jgi:glycosyltransferase involved in cell wall biosynthesis
LPANQKLWAAVARDPEIELDLIAPKRWVSPLHGPLDFAALPELSEQARGLAVYRAGSLHWHTYADLGPELTLRVPDVMYLDEDPHSLVAAQVLSIQAIMDYRLIITLKQNVFKRYPLPFSWIEKRTFRLSSCAAATSEECVRVARDKGFRRAAELVYYAIDTEEFRPNGKRQRAVGEPLVVGYAGRLVPEKGLADLIAALALVQKDRRVQLSIVGSGPERARLAALAGMKLPGGACMFFDRLPREEMAQWYRSLDALVLPSRTTPQWKEQFGRVLGEAMACEIPVIGSSSGFIPEFIETTGGGLTYPEGDVEALAEAILTLAKDETKAEELGRKGREGVIANYGLEAIAARIVQLVQSCGEGPRTRVLSPAERLRSRGSRAGGEG